MQKRISDIITAVLFIGGTIAFIVLAGLEMYSYALTVLGGIFLTLGIIGLVKNRHCIIDTGNACFVILMVAGAVTVFSSLLYSDTELSSRFENDRVKIILIGSCIGCLIMGGFTVFVSIAERKIKLRCCTCEVYAECVDQGRRLNGDETKTPAYIPTWKYTYNDKVYIIQSNFGTNMNTPPVKGQNYLLMIDPDNPHRFYSPQFTHWSNLTALGIFIIAAGIALYCYAFLGL